MRSCAYILIMIFAIQQNVAEAATWQVKVDTPKIAPTVPGKKIGPEQRVLTMKVQVSAPKSSMIKTRDIVLLTRGGAKIPLFGLGGTRRFDVFFPFKRPGGGMSSTTRVAEGKDVYTVATGSGGASATFTLKQPRATVFLGFLLPHGVTSAWLRLGSAKVRVPSIAVKVDRATKKRWARNCAAYRDYRGKLIWTVVMKPRGMATRRRGLLKILRRIEPEGKLTAAQLKQLVSAVQRAPAWRGYGGSDVAISTSVNAALVGLMRTLNEEAQQQGVPCTQKR